jgi:hypothetical protein
LPAAHDTADTDCNVNQLSLQDSPNTTLPVTSEQPIPTRRTPNETASQARQSTPNDTDKPEPIVPNLIPRVGQPVNAACILQTVPAVSPQRETPIAITPKIPAPLATAQAVSTAAASTLSHMAPAVVNVKPHSTTKSRSSPKLASSHFAKLPTILQPSLNPSSGTTNKQILENMQLMASDTRDYLVHNAFSK